MKVESIEKNGFTPFSITVTFESLEEVACFMASINTNTAAKKEAAHSRFRNVNFDNECNVMIFDLIEPKILKNI